MMMQMRTWGLHGLLDATRAFEAAKDNFSFGYVLLHMVQSLTVRKETVLMCPRGGPMALLRALLRENTEQASAMRNEISSAASAVFLAGIRASGPRLGRCPRQLLRQAILKATQPAKELRAAVDQVFKAVVQREHTDEGRFDHPDDPAKPEGDWAVAVPVDDVISLSMAVVASQKAGKVLGDEDDEDVAEDEHDPELATGGPGSDAGEDTDDEDTDTDEEAGAEDTDVEEQDEAKSDTDEEADEEAGAEDPYEDDRTVGNQLVPRVVEEQSHAPRSQGEQRLARRTARARKPVLVENRTDGDLLLPRVEEDQRHAPRSQEEQCHGPRTARGRKPGLRTGRNPCAAAQPRAEVTLKKVRSDMLKVLRRHGLASSVGRPAGVRNRWAEQRAASEQPLNDVLNSPMVVACYGLALRLVSLTKYSAVRASPQLVRRFYDALLDCDDPWVCQTRAWLSLSLLRFLRVSSLKGQLRADTTLCVNDSAERFASLNVTVSANKGDGGAAGMIHKMPHDKHCPYLLRNLDGSGGVDNKNGKGYVKQAVRGVICPVCDFLRWRGWQEEFKVRSGGKAGRDCQCEFVRVDPPPPSCKGDIPTSTPAPSVPPMTAEAAHASRHGFVAASQSVGDACVAGAPRPFLLENLLGQSFLIVGTAQPPMLLEEEEAEAVEGLADQRALRVHPSRPLRSKDVISTLRWLMAKARAEEKEELDSGMQLANVERVPSEEQFPSVRIISHMLRRTAFWLYKAVRGPDGHLLSNAQIALLAGCTEKNVEYYTRIAAESNGLESQGSIGRRRIDDGAGSDDLAGLADLVCRCQKEFPDADREAVRDAFKTAMMDLNTRTVASFLAMRVEVVLNVLANSSTETEPLEMKWVVSTLESWQESARQIGVVSYAGLVNAAEQCRDVSSPARQERAFGQGQDASERLERALSESGTLDARSAKANKRAPDALVREALLILNSKQGLMTQEEQREASERIWNLVPNP